MKIIVYNGTPDTPHGFFFDGEFLSPVLAGEGEPHSIP
jgi:hypothetical protein